MSQEKSEESIAGETKEDNLWVTSEGCAMIAQDKENMDDEENSTMVFVSVNMSHSQEHYDDLMEQESNSNRDKTEHLYIKTLNTVPFFQEIPKRVQC